MSQSTRGLVQEQQSQEQRLGAHTLADWGRTECFPVMGSGCPGKCPCLHFLVQHNAGMRRLKDKPRLPGLSSRSQAPGPSPFPRSSLHLCPLLPCQSSRRPRACIGSQGTPPKAGAASSAPAARVTFCLPATRRRQWRTNRDSPPPPDLPFWAHYLPRLVVLRGFKFLCAACHPTLRPRIP